MVKNITASSKNPLAKHIYVSTTNLIILAHSQVSTHTQALLYPFSIWNCCCHNVTELWAPFPVRCELIWKRMPCSCCMHNDNGSNELHKYMHMHCILDVTDKSLAHDSARSIACKTVRSHGTCCVWKQGTAQCNWKTFIKSWTLTWRNVKRSTEKQRSGTKKMRSVWTGH